MVNGGDLGLLQVYERTRSKGVHAGDKYKAYVDTEKGITFYSQKQAIDNGFKNRTSTHSSP